MDFAYEIHCYTLELPVGIFLYEMEDIFRILLQLMDRVGVGWVHRHGNGAFNGRKIHDYAAVIISNFSRAELFVCLRPAVGDKVVLSFLIGYPDRRPAGSLGGHHIDRIAILDRKPCNARPDELHHFVLHIAVFINSSDNGECYILRADAGLRFAGQINGYHTRIRKIIGTS